MKRLYRDWKLGREFKKLAKDPRYAGLKKKAREYLSQLPVYRGGDNGAP